MMKVFMQIILNDKEIKDLGGNLEIFYKECMSVFCICKEDEGCFDVDCGRCKSFHKITDYSGKRLIK